MLTLEGTLALPTSYVGGLEPEFLGPGQPGCDWHRHTGIRPIPYSLKSLFTRPAARSVQDNASCLLEEALATSKVTN